MPIVAKQVSLWSRTAMGDAMEGLLLLIALVLAVWLLNLNGRIKLLEERISILIDRMNAGSVAPLAAQRDVAEEVDASTAPPPAMAYAGRKPANIKGELPDAKPRATIEAPPPLPEPATEAAPKRSWSFEELVGGKLPIWVGGISLVFGLPGIGVHIALGAVVVELDAVG